MKISVTCFLALLSFIQTASATQGPVKFRPTGTSNVVYFGGPVISHVKLYNIYWGADVTDEVKSVAPDFYSTMVNSDFMDIAKEYSTKDQTIDGGSFAETLTITPSENLSKVLIDDTEIQAELEKQILEGHLPEATNDTLFMVHFPPGMTITTDDGNGNKLTSCEQLCAFHNGFKSKLGSSIYYSVLPDFTQGACAWGCGMGGSVNALTMAASHEMMEAITDPFPTPGSHPAFPQAWNTVDGSEIGDLCTGGSATLSGGKRDYKVQEQWSNKLGACTFLGSYKKNSSSIFKKKL